MTPDIDRHRAGVYRLLSLREQTEAIAEEMAAERERFARLADPASAPRAVSAFNLFQTPAGLATRLAGLFEPRHLGTDGSPHGCPAARFLEPSAGLGRLYHALRAVAPQLPAVLVDSAAACCCELYRATEGDADAILYAGDFMAKSPDQLGRFSAIMMNPPFQRGTDVRHVMHARNFLSPGGRLVAVVADGRKQRELLGCHATTYTQLPAGSFRSEGTDVATAVVVFDAPLETDEVTA